jgi:lipoprotein-anchoring transpeptidase ErfK/SrfK
MSSPLNSTALLAFAGAALFLSSCATDPGRQTALLQTTPPRHPPTVVSEAGFSNWSDHHAGGPLQVRIDLSEQTASFHRGGVNVGQSRVATGRSGHATPTGSFTIQEKIAQKHSNIYGSILNAQGNVVVSDADTRIHSVPSGGRFVGAPMPYWMRLTSHGVGMHVGPIPNPGSPASHGCIRMPREMARTLFEKAPVGTQVTIVP